MRRPVLPLLLGVACASVPPERGAPADARGTLAEARGDARGRGVCASSRFRDVRIETCAQADSGLLWFRFEDEGNPALASPALYRIEALDEEGRVIARQEPEGEPGRPGPAAGSQGRALFSRVPGGLRPGRYLVRYTHLPSGTLAAVHTIALAP